MHMCYGTPRWPCVYRTSKCTCVIGPPDVYVTEPPDAHVFTRSPNVHVLQDPQMHMCLQDTQMYICNRTTRCTHYRTPRCTCVTGLPNVHVTGPPNLHTLQDPQMHVLQDPQMYMCYRTSRWVLLHSKQCIRDHLVGEWIRASNSCRHRNVTGHTSGHAFEHRIHWIVKAVMLEVIFISRVTPFRWLCFLENSL